MSDDRSVLSRPAAEPDDVIIYGAHRDAVADVRYAADGRTRPLVVVVHGGFWRPEYDRVTAGAGPMSAALAEAGWTTASIEYRRAPGSPDLTLADVALAVETLPSLVGEQDGRAVLVGHSAGGHLVLWAAAESASSVVGVVPLAAVADLSLADRLGLGSGAVRDFLGTAPTDRPDVDPAQRPAPSVPVHLVHGADDSIVPPELARAYIQRHPTTRLDVVPRTGHFDLIDPLTAAWPVVVDAIRRVPASRPG